jgi:hypothetical protein
MRPPNEALEFHTNFIHIYIDNLRFYDLGVVEGVAWVQLQCQGDSRDPTGYGDG